MTATALDSGISATWNAVIACIRLSNGIIADNASRNAGELKCTEAAILNCHFDLEGRASPEEVT
jgi:hypothetical protein